MVGKSYIGIDNGVTGSLAFVSATYVCMVQTPVITQQNYTKARGMITRIDYKKLESILSEWSIIENPVMVVVERPYVNPEGFKATASALRALEATLIAVEGLGFPYQYVDSRVWQRVMLPSGLKGSANLKSASKDIGLRLFPTMKDVIGKQKDSDSLLIAEWARRVTL